MKAFLKHAPEIPPYTTPDMLTFVSHSVILGFLLMTVTVLTGLKNGKRKKILKSDSGLADLLYDSSNVLYLCVGMTSVMLLVNNNLARAFAIGAAIALVRFRIKVDSKNFGMCLFFGVIIGMACGVNQVPLAYGLVGIFVAMQGLIFVLALLVSRHMHVPDVKVVPLEPANESVRG